ncbi:EmrA Multidrug resistance efflux pump [Spirosomataceae bacterium]
MQKQLYPSETIDYALETYLPKVNVKSQLIYTSILLFVLGVFVALPFVYVDISVASPGVIRTLSEKTELKSLVSGRITKMDVAENQMVKAGDILYAIATEELDNKLALSVFDERENNQKLADLKTLLHVEKNNLFSNFRTSTGLYTQQLNLFRSQLQENLFAQKKIDAELNSDRQLYHDKVISKRELDSKEYELTKLRAEYASIFQRQKSQWQAELNGFRLEAEQKRAEKNQVIQQKQFYEIKAPVSGNIQQVVGKYEGSYIQTGESLGIISPDSSILVECYVSPQDIGLLKPDMPVRFQIDAFNYNEWGLVNGKIAEVAKDFVVISEQPVFKVRCLLEKQEVSLPTGYKATLKKGMSLRARFIVTKRSLFQLLYDKVDDWVNPSMRKF